MAIGFWLRYPTRNPMAYCLWALLLGLIPAGAMGATPTGGSQVLSGLGSGPCTHLDLTADTMDCGRSSCVLHDNAVLRCESLRLWADEIEVEITPDGAFGGAVGRNNVLLVETNRIITCDTIMLAADRIQAKMSDAVVHVKTGVPVIPFSEIPTGRDQMTISGAQMQRLTKDQLHIDQGTFTMCDCDNDLPSWQLTSNAIDATLGERATIWWPIFWITPFGLPFQVPITPPLPPLSIPLKGRAAGFLAPQISIYAPPWPMVD